MFYPILHKKWADRPPKYILKKTKYGIIADLYSDAKFAKAFAMAQKSPFLPKGVPVIVALLISQLDVRLKSRLTPFFLPNRCTLSVLYREKPNIL